MFLEILLAVIVGCCFGIFTGLAPGIHVNLVSVILLSISPFLLHYTNVIVLCVFIVAMAITHSFLDAVPAIFLGAPDSDQVMNVLPGHKLLLEGKGFEAVKLTIIGSLLALLAGIVLVPIFVPIMPSLYTYLSKYMGWILLAVVAFMILKDKKRHWNFVIFLMSGILGIIVLGMPNLKNPLFPLLSGLFGISGLIISLQQKVKIPQQSVTETIKLKKSELAQAIGAGTVAGSLTGFFPGLGPAQGAVLVSQFFKKMSNYGFMVLVGGINTVNFLFSLITLYAIEKARNGAVIVIAELLTINIKYVIMFIAVALIAGGFSTFMAMKISKVFSKVISKVNYQKLCLAIILLVAALVFYFSGFTGLLVLAASTAIGLIPPLMGVARNHSMGCLLLPVMLYFLM
jgi:putative membrane protein